VTDVSGFPGPEGGKVDLPENLNDQIKQLFEHMGIEPDGTVPPLDPELRMCVVERRNAGTMINHPLVHDFYIPGNNGRYNKTLKLKRKLIDELCAKREWDKIFLLGYVERPYQLEWLNRWAPEMPDEVYWEILGDIWTDSENIWQHKDGWREALSSERPRRECIMNTETYEELKEGEPPRQKNEREFYESLPDVVKVYRGNPAPDGGSGLSWTLNRSVAVMFAKRLRLPGMTPKLISGKVRKENVLAFFDRRAEAEIVCFPEHIFDRMERKVK
jgi:hypothetical protein